MVEMLGNETLVACGRLQMLGNEALVAYGRVKMLGNEALVVFGRVQMLGNEALVVGGGGLKTFQVSIVQCVYNMMRDCPQIYGGTYRSPHSTMPPPPPSPPPICRSAYRTFCKRGPHAVES